MRVALIAFCVLLTPFFASAGVPDPFIYDTRLIGLPMIVGASYGTYQTAVRVGNTPTLQTSVHTFSSIPLVSTDLSSFGLSSFATTSGMWRGYGAPYYPSYFYNFGPIKITASIPDGIYSVPITAVGAYGTATTTINVVVDNVPPTISLSSITFSISTTSPRAGDYMYLSGSANGTGSTVKVSGIYEGLFDASGNSLSWYARTTGDMIAYSSQSINNALASSTDGTFTNVPIKLSESDDPGQIARATSFRIRLTVYDEAGNTASTSLMIPVPKKTDPPDPCANGGCVSNVLFLPGIEASRLYEYVSCVDGVCEAKLWEPGGDDLASRLMHDANGTSIQSDVYAKSIIDNAYVPVKGNIYKSFIEQMDGIVAAGTMRAWEAIPYDWRLTPDQILDSGAVIAPGKISYLTATSSPYIMQELKKLASTSKSGKVTIVAHSNGGLVTKRLVEKLGPDASKFIDKIIFVAVPQVGTPQAIGALLHGYDQGLPSSFVSYGLSDGTAQSLAKNMPMTYNLLPSNSYFTQVDTPVVSFSDQSLLAEFRARYGDLIHSTERLRSFVTDAWRTASSTTEGLAYPSVGNELLFRNAEALHAGLDAWKPPTGITLYEIAGWGEKTLAGIDYYQGISVQCDQAVSVLSRCIKTPKIDYRPRIVLDGDGTVVTPSALWTQGAKRYWVDLKTYAKDNRLTAPLGRQHADILEVEELRMLLQNIITNNNNLNLPQYISTSTPPNPNSDTEFRFTLHSPLSLHLYDDQGRHTGISTTTGELEENIPGSRYMRFGEVQFISAPSSLNTQLVMNGYAPGSFTLDVEEVFGENTIASTTFAGIPSTINTVATMNTSTKGISDFGALVVDKNNDGQPDITLHAKEGGVVTLDTTPPITTFSAQGTVGLRDWYTSDAVITLVATDTESSVASTTYSLDGGTTWSTYLSPFAISQEGATTISYYSTDSVGNAESIASTTIKIDKTAPEARISFATTTSMLSVSGVDTGSSVSVSTQSVRSVKNEERKKEYREKGMIVATLADEAGNTTILTYTTPHSDSKQRDAATIVSVSYNGVATSSVAASTQYKWVTDKKGKYVMFASYLKTVLTTMEAHYYPKKNITTVMLKPQELDEREDNRGLDSRPVRTSFPGLLVPGLQTEKGNIKITY